jgi:hypothetical protein
MNVLESFIQGCSGAVVESEGRRFAPTLCSITFLLHRRKIPAAHKTQQKIQALMAKAFLLYVRNESAAPGLGNGKSRQAL